MVSLDTSRENPRSGAASIDRSDQTALQGTAPQRIKSHIYRRVRSVSTDGRGKHAHTTAAARACSLCRGFTGLDVPEISGDGTPSRPSKARGANIFASSRRDSNLEAFSRYPADVAAHHWPLGQVRAPEVRYCGSSRTEQGFYRENQSSGG